MKQQNTPSKQARNVQENEWYKKWWIILIGVILTLFFIWITLPAILIWVVWKKTKLNTAIKIISTIFIVIISISIMANIDSNKTTKTTNVPRENNEAIQKNKNPDNTTTNLSTKEAPESINVEVTNKIIKHVGKKYRYFFDIRNNDDKDFTGTVVIKLYNNDGSMLGIESFSTNQPIQPNLGNSVYIDANTGPKSVHGASGITTFKYEVKIEDVTTKSDEGLIIDKYENLSF